VIARSVATGFDWYAGRRRRRLEALWRRPAEVQEAALRSLLKSAGDTEFGLAHGFRSIRTVAQYQERVPVREYADFEPLWERAVAGARGVTWPGFCRDWVKTSGTTGGSKVIPVTTEAFASHRKGGWDALLLACSRVGARQLFGGPMLSLGGSTELKAVALAAGWVTFPVPPCAVCLRVSADATLLARRSGASRTGSAASTPSRNW